ncbi:MAG: adenosylhomocysteine nucleosidase [Planctomycetota bacterium]|jgi:adenosylhomocysteine nucleosidase
MLIWVCALHCEAKPIIDFYRLKKSHEESAFDLYSNTDMACIISGVGKMNSAIATAWVAAKYSDCRSIAWVNLGTAGARDAAIGSIYAINQVLQAANDKSFYSPLMKVNRMATASCITIDQERDDYHAQHLFDMEAAGFYQAATRFSSLELIQCIKVISDNSNHPRHRDRQAISDLIYGNIEAIDQVFRQLMVINQGMINRDIGAQDWLSISGLASFSQTQKNKLRGLLRYLLNRQHSVEDIQCQLKQYSTAAAMIKALELLSFDDSSRL